MRIVISILFFRFVFVCLFVCCFLFCVVVVICSAVDCQTVKDNGGGWLRVANRVSGYALLCICCHWLCNYLGRWWWR